MWKTDFKERILKNCVPEPNTGCWLWTAFSSVAGYGITVRNKKREFAHRISYEYFVNKIDKGMFILHKCDTPACVNPQHLFLGTKKDNAVDKCQKGRHHNQKKTHCKKGHPKTEENRHKNGRSAYVCRACMNERNTRRHIPKHLWGDKAAYGRNKTHCKYGHERNSENNYINRLTGAKSCNICRRRRSGSKEIGHING